MLYYNRILETEGIDFEKNKNSNSRQCEICSFYYFTNKNFRFQHYLCDGCHDLTMLKNITILKIRNYHYRIYFEHMTKDDAKKNLENLEFNLVDKKGYL